MLKYWIIGGLALLKVIKKSISYNVLGDYFRNGSPKILILIELLKVVFTITNWPILSRY